MNWPATSSMSVMYCSRCRGLIGARWFIVDGLDVCPQCYEDTRPPADTRDVEHSVAVTEIATLRSRIATLESQVEQARTALEGICRCDRYPMHCAECPAARSYCATLIAGQALREGADHAE